MEDPTSLSKRSKEMKITEIKKYPLSHDGRISYTLKYVLIMDLKGLVKLELEYGKDSNFSY